MFSPAQLTRRVVSEYYNTCERLRTLYPKILASKTSKIVKDPITKEWVCRQAADPTYPEISGLIGDLTRFNVCYQYTVASAGGKVTIGHVHSFNEMLLRIYNDPQVAVPKERRDEYSTQEWELITRLHRRLHKSQQTKTVGGSSDNTKDKREDSKDIPIVPDSGTISVAEQCNTVDQGITALGVALTEMFEQIAVETDQDAQTQINSPAQEFCDKVVDAMTEG